MIFSPCIKSHFRYICEHFTFFNVIENKGKYKRSPRVFIPSIISFYLLKH